MNACLQGSPLSLNQHEMTEKIVMYVEHIRKNQGKSSRDCDGALYVGKRQLSSTFKTSNEPV